jgi:RNA polymerase sigma-70 factor (ECF subfamily)
MSGSPDIPEQYWEVVERCRPELIAQAQAILGSREDAEDVVQETFCEAARHVEQLAQAESVLAWLKSINRANALDNLRSRQRDSKRVQTRHEQSVGDAFTTGGFSRLELGDTLRTAMATLPPHLREAVRLRYFEHLSYKQIAVQLKIPIGNVGGMLMDASVALFAQLSARLPVESPKLPEGETQTVLPVVDPRRNSAQGERS